VLRTALALLADLLRLLRLMFRSRTQLAVENLFLRKQLACYIERQVRPRRTDDASRIALVFLAQFVEWRELLTIVKPDTLVRWHRDLFRLFWRLKSRHRGRPRIPANVQRLIVEMAMKNRTWGEERIAAELRLKVGLTLSPRTVRRYMPSRPRRSGGQPTQAWSTFLRNHAGAVLACDFFIVVTATFQTPVRFRHPRHRHTPRGALESHQPSHSGVDHPAVPQRPSSGRRVSLARARS
jgi:putative transposase